MVSPKVSNWKVCLKQRIGLVLFCLLLVALVSAYWQWDGIVQYIVTLQKELHGLLARHILAISKDTDGFGSSLIALSFGYGVFHAIGPGHGKAIIVTYLATHKEKTSKGIIMSFAAAMMQALVAIILVTVLAEILQYKFSQVRDYGGDIAVASYVLVIILGLMLFLKTGYRLVKSGLAFSKAHDEHASHHDHHHHHGSCGCNHAYVPDDKQTFFETVMVVLSMGMRPCSGAIVVLIYAHLVGVYFYGMLSTILMGVGTGLSVCLLAVIAQSARSWLEKVIIRKENDSWLSRLPITDYVRLLGGIILIFLGWSFYNAASIAMTNHPLL